MDLEVRYPYLFLLILPAAFVLYLFIKQAIRQRKWSLETGLIVSIRGIIFVCLIFALTVPQILLPVNGEKVVFLVDRSASTDGTEAAVLDWIDQAVSQKDKDDSYAIVTFGKNAAMERAFGKSDVPVASFNAEIDSSETDIEGGIQFASSLFHNGTGGRIVLLTDGNETVGSGKDVASLLRNQQVELDVVALNRSAAEDMSLETLSVPPSLYEGETVPISLTINSSSSKQATVRISVNNKETLIETVAVKEGKNVFTFSHPVEETGLIVYKGEISAENDRYLENNMLYSMASVKGTPRILLVQKDSDSHIQTLLQSSGSSVEMLPPEKLPTTLSGFLAYQSIIFNNVPATVITENQMSLIEQAVKEFGVGFIMAGGEDSFGLGGYFKTPIEKLLPVDMEIKGKNEMPSLGMVIVMDRSGSMAGSKITLAKEAAARSVELLREEDSLGFIAFDDRPWEIVKTNPLKNKKKVIEQIRSVTPGGGTEIFSSLEKAYQDLEDLKLQRKHIILLTDGQSATRADYDTLIEEGKDNNITLSTVAIGSDADRNILEELAEGGSGRFYDVTDSSVIPSILARETVMATRTYIEDNPFYPTIQPYPEWLPLFQDGVAQMNAYIATMAKPRAAVPILSEKKDPVLAGWQYGMGYTIAFTSDFSGKWSGNWAAWDKWPAFINQMVTMTLPKYDSDPFELSIDRKDGNFVAILESANSSMLPLEAALISEKGKRFETNSKIIAPGKYEVDIPDEAGMYFISVNETTETGETKSYQTGFTIPYSEEYLLLGTNREGLKELAGKAEGTLLQKEKDAFRSREGLTFEKQAISQLLLLAVFLLYFSEISIRRFGLKRLSRVFAKDNSKRVLSDAEKTENIERFQRVKQWVQPRPQKKKEKPDRPSEEGPVKQMNRGSEKTKTKNINQQKQSREEERKERMQRLLDAKNKKK